MNIQKLHWDAISFSYENNQIYKIKISEYRNYKDKLEMSLFIRVTPKACVLYMGHPSLLYITRVILVRSGDPRIKQVPVGHPSHQILKKEFHVNMHIYTACL